MTIKRLQKMNQVSAAPIGIRGTFVRNPHKGNRWQHINAIYFDGWDNTYASYTDEEILASVCED